MKRYISVVSGNESEKQILALLHNVNQVLDNLHHHKSSAIINHKLYTFGWSDTFRLLVEELNDCPLVYRNLILNSAHAVYSRCPLAVQLYLLTLKSLFNKNNGLTPEIFEAYAGELRKCSKRTTSDFVKEMWENTLQDELTKDNFENICHAVSAAGSLGVIEIKPGRYFEAKTSCGISVSASLPVEFNSRVAPIINLEDCKIVVVDGAVLSISDLNRVLTYANETKSNMAIFASQFSNDVLNTLIVNWNNGRLKVIPLEFLRELNDLNQAVDLATITSTAMVSKDNGKTLTTIEEEEIQEVKSLNVDSTKRKCEIILHQKNINSLLALRSDIQRKRDEETVQDVKDILAVRLARLTSRKTTITLPYKKEEIGITKDRISDLFSLIKACSNEGISSISSLYGDITKHPHPRLPSHLPTISAQLAILRAVSDFNQINKIGALILLDD